MPVPIYHPLMIFHLTSAIVWIGAVFMGTFVDWPVIRRAATNGRFPFDFIVGQGVRVAPAVYVGIISQLVSATGLVLLRPPQTVQQMVMLTVKAICLAFMTGSTLYGTFATWRKIQFATHQEAYALYETYMLRASITFLCGIAASVIGHFYRTWP
jgi:hypothetical protein